jgi:hypothetical protein
MILKTKEEYTADFINQFLDKAITAKFIKKSIAIDEFENVQDFICDNLKAEFGWSTGIGLFEAAEHCFAVAKGNANFSGDLGFELSEEIK